MDTSVGTRLFAKATEALKALRAAAVAQQQATRFNEYLDRLRLSYQLDMVKQLWWRSLMQQGIGPVHDQEVSGAGMSRAAAEQYVRVHGADEVDPAGGFGIASAADKCTDVPGLHQSTSCTAGLTMSTGSTIPSRGRAPLWFSMDFCSILHKKLSC